MKIIVPLAAVMFLAPVFTASAASVSNTDSENVTVIVTENGERKEIDIAPGTAMELCLSGCFVTFPSGDMLALTGNEKVVVEQGAGTISGE